MAADSPSPPRPVDWAAALAAARQPPVPPPPSEFLDVSPISSAPPATPFSKALKGMAAKIGGRAHLVFDLDDTLLVTDYTARDAWQPDPFSAVPIFPAWDFRRMRASWWLTLRNGWRLPRRHRYDPRTYAFLAQPVITAQWRPGTFGLLAGLQAAGHTLYLATASSQVRWDFLCGRFPFLGGFFPPERVACAEDLLAATVALGQPAETYFLKSPELLRKALSLPQLDGLIDDSTLAATFYNGHKLADRFIHAEAKDPHGPVLAKLPGILSNRLAGTAIHSTPPLPPPGQGDCLRFEDPFYRPFLNNPDAGEALRAALIRPHV